MQTLDVLSQITGWIYFWAWGLSFYPQIYMFYNQKSAFGYNVDYAVYMFVGYIAYSLYTWFGAFNPELVGIVSIADIAFALNSFWCVLVILWQMYHYGTGGQKLTKLAVRFISLIVILSLVFIVLQETAKLPGNSTWNVILWFGYIKIIMTVVSYTPQVIHIMKRQSTKNFSCSAIGFDFMGGVFSLLQMAIDTLNYNAEGSFNIAKFLLGLIGMTYDCIFFFQFWYYQDLDPKETFEELETIELEVLSLRDTIKSYDLTSVK